MSTWSTRILSLLKDGDRVVGAFGYDRERGRFKIFRAKAVVLATGGIGRAYKITSNSWEYTGDGHALAYHAGAELIDMEFIQFHPTGMVWPPSVLGILVTEGVRGEGGILTNADGKRFMFDVIPENYQAQTADNEEEGWRYSQGDKNARRPPELLTRDHVSRCIVREIKEGRGSPHGGVFLDISWIKEKNPKRGGTHQTQAAEHVSPIQTLADIDITKRADGSRADYALHHGWRACGSRIRRCPMCRDCLPPANARPESMARIGSAAIRFPIFWFSANEPANSRRSSRRKIARRNRQRQDRHVRPRSAGAVRATVDGENPVSSSAAICRKRCSTTSESCATKAKCSAALDHLRNFWERAGGSASQAIANTIPVGTPRSI